VDGQLHIALGRRGARRGWRGGSFDVDFDQLEEVLMGVDPYSSN
jgi:hypothetical protein